MIYCNNAATSWPKPATVYEAVNRYMQYCGSSHARGNDKNSFSASELMYECRTRIAQLINAYTPERIIFTFNATDAINTALKGVLKKGDHVIITDMEHNAVLRPLKKMENIGLIELSIIPTDADGLVRLANIENAVRSNTALIEVIHASNVTGVVNGLKEIGIFCLRNNIYFMVDGSQSLGCIPVDVTRDNIAILAAPGHKGLLGPQGTGFLYLAPHVTIASFREGGTGSQSESFFQPEIFPDKLESGTMNMPGIAGLHAGVAYLLAHRVEKLYAIKRELMTSLQKGIRNISGLKFYAPEDKEMLLCSFNVAHADSHAICASLAGHGIAVRGGLHCAYLVHQKFFTIGQGMVRVSPGIFNREDEIEILIHVLKKLAESVARVKEPVLRAEVTHV